MLRSHNICATDPRRFGLCAHRKSSLEHEPEISCSCDSHALVGATRGGVESKEPDGQLLGKVLRGWEVLGFVVVQAREHSGPAVTVWVLGT